MDRRERRRATERRYLRWNEEENRDYVKFVIENMELFVDQVKRKNTMIFTKMAEQLNNGRDNQQCRSHHMKLILKFGNIQKVIEGLKEPKKEH